MSHKLPSLNAIKAFEAAARHLSFKQAASELHVTAGAVSQQIKTLEHWLGTQLFVRNSKSLELTSSGADYLPAVRNAFKIISDATQKTAKRELHDVIPIGVQPSFALERIYPNLKLFSSKYPGIRLRFSASTDLDGLREGSVHAVIRYEVRPTPGFKNFPIFHSRVIPVCSPLLFEFGRSLLRPTDVRHFVLLHGPHRDNWSAWLAAHDIHDIDPTAGVSFTDARLAMQAASRGAGIALAPSNLSDAELASLGLVKPFDADAPQESGFYLICADGLAECAKMKAFRAFLTEVTASDDLSRLVLSSGRDGPSTVNTAA